MVLWHAAPESLVNLLINLRTVHRPAARVFGDHPTLTVFPLQRLANTSLGSASTPNSAAEVHCLAPLLRALCAPRLPAVFSGP